MWLAQPLVTNFLFLACTKLMTALHLPVITDVLSEQNETICSWYLELFKFSMNQIKNVFTSRMNAQILQRKHHSLFFFQEKYH